MNSVHEVLAELRLHLPRNAEEGGDVESVAESALIQSLARITGDELSAKTIVLVVRRIFQSLGLLDPHHLKSGCWQLVSFPALLLARSLLAGLGEQQFPVLDAGFWDSSENRIDPQRNLLRFTEQRRCSATTRSEPIRRVWVAWAVMAMDDRFLLMRREDPSGHREGSRGQFVLPGGRVSSLDLGEMERSDRLAFFDPISVRLGEPVEQPAFRQALLRELQEELDLEASDIKAIHPVSGVIEFVSLEGAKSAHAVTEYLIQLFQVELTESGKGSLLDCLSQCSSRFSWFSVDQIIKGVNERGDRAFVDALISELQDNVLQVLNPRSSDLKLGDVPPIDEPLDIPLGKQTPLLIGTTGHERSVVLTLSDEALELLGILAVIRRGESISQMREGLRIASGTGWLIAGTPGIFAEMKGLADEVNFAVPATRLIAIQGHALRLNVLNPGHVYFAKDALDISIKDENRGKSYRLCVARKAINTRFGSAPSVSRENEVAGKLGAAIYGLVKGDAREAIENWDNVKRLQRNDLRLFLDAVGVRLLIRQVDGVPELSASPLTWVNVAPVA